MPGNKQSFVGKYTYRVVWSEDDQEYVGLCAEFSSLSFLAQTQAAALSGICRTVMRVVQDMKKNHEPIPDPLSSKKYSGKLLVRISPDIHKRLALEAFESKISINHLISTKLACNV